MLVAFRFTDKTRIDVAFKVSMVAWRMAWEVGDDDS
jgi:hypothetical protein